MFRGMGKAGGHILTMHPETQQRIGSDETKGGVKKKRVTFEETEEPTRKKTKQSEAIHIPKKVYRPKMPNIYVDPPFIPDELDGLEPLFRDYGPGLLKETKQLPPREDVIQFDEHQHAQQMDDNLNLKIVPEEHHGIIKSLVKEFWDVFSEEGLRKHIRGFQFTVNTGNARPVCCKLPRYGQHEARVMRDLLAKLARNNMVEDIDSPWGSMIVLASKPNQANTPWYRLIWRFCVSYRRLNEVTKPMQYPIPRCDDATEDIPNWATVFITMDMDSGYWQILATKQTREKLAFFTPDGMKTFTCMPMGAKNAAPFFVAMMMFFQKRWDQQAEQEIPEWPNGIRMWVVRSSLMTSSYTRERRKRH